LGIVVEAAKGPLMTVERTRLTGSYRILNRDFLEEKSQRLNDPRHHFYRSLLTHRTYEGYLADVGSKVVRVPTYDGDITGRMEILYCRRSQWIADGD
jgi:hypothetical protein